LEKLEWIQQKTSGIIPLTINLWEEFGVRISMRREATTEALNAVMNGPTIDTNNRWRKVEAAKGKMPRFFYATKVYSSLSRFEAPVDIFFGHLREGRWGFYNFSTKVLACF
jgi:hypothetical protein